jgi:spore germination cell wall hydrolase CwlJ-like protein
LSAILKFGGPAALGLSLFVMWQGLALSAPAATVIAVDPTKVQAEATLPEPLPAPPTAPLATTPVAAANPVPLVQETTPTGLRALVADQAAHPGPMRPEVECMARAVYREAANQALSGQLAVAQVILNRVKSGAFPRSACAVVDQPGQFSQAPPTAAAPAASKPWNAAVAVAIIAEENRFPQVAPGALFFHAASMRPAWSGEHERIAQIGDHIFYR